MKSKTGAGFTLIEISVTMGILAILATFLALGSLDMYRGFAFREEENLLIAVLERARSESVNNVCLGASCTDGKSHGIVIQAGQYVIFQGNSYVLRDSSQDENIAANASIVRSGLAEIVFSQLSGDANVSGNINMTDGERLAVISINNEGRTSW